MQNRSHSQGQAQTQTHAQAQNQAEVQAFMRADSQAAAQVKTQAQEEQEQMQGSDTELRLPEGEQKGSDPHNIIGRPIEDGYNWRKYGQKQVKGSKYPRSYYKCTSPNCQAKMEVERFRHGQITEIVYEGAHNHPKPQPSHRSAFDSTHMIDEGAENTKGSSATAKVEGGSTWRNTELGLLKDKEEQEQMQGSDTELRLPEGEQKGSDPHTIIGRPTEDGYTWRKYGQKQVKGREYPWSYFKCSRPNYQVKKKVERSKIVYKGLHNHPKPQPSRRSAFDSTHMIDEGAENTKGSSDTAKVEGGSTWRNTELGLLKDKDATNSSKAWKNELLERSSSASVVTDLSYRSSAAQVQSSSRLDSLGDPELSLTLASDADMEDGGNNDSKSLGDDGDENESDSKRRKKEENNTVDIVAAPRAIREQIDIFDDKYQRRKYGLRVVKGNPNPRNQVKLLKQMVATVNRIPKIRSPVVGLDEAVENFERKMAEFAQERQKNGKLVAIVGTGGSGKTTLAKRFFKVKCSAFDASCFLYVREASAMHRLPTLQGKLLKELLHLDYEIYNTNHGRELLRSRFASVRTTSRFLIVLDDIEHNDQLDDLLVKEVLRTDSLIIITSRDSSLFSSRPETILYEMKTMDEKHARELFCLHAFCQCHPVIGFESVVEGFLRVCDGLPLSLEVCGALLRGNSDLYQWELQLHELSEVPKRDMKHKLPISYDTLGKDEKMMFLAYKGLTEHCQEAFLDICWFLGGWDWETVASIVGKEELLTLASIHLVTRDIDKVRVCYTAAGISRKLSKGLRITSTEELSLVLEQEQNVDEIKGIWLMDNKVRFELPAEKLDQMHSSLRVLALGDWTVVKGTCNNRFQSMRFLQAGNVPYLPFSIANLDQLRLLQNGSGQEMGFSAAENIPPTLRKLEMCQRNYCSGLELTSQVVMKLQNLRSLELQEFVGLFMLPDEFQLLNHLTKLNLTGCSLLKLPEGLDQLNALKHLNLSRCGGLKELPESIGQLQSLRTLNLQFCTKLSQLPQRFKELKLLRILKLKGCRSLQRLPDLFGLLVSLEDLNLCGCAKLRFLPSTFSRLSSLRTLNLKKCQSLLDLPYDIGNLPLMSFKLLKCSKLTMLPQSMGLLTSLLHRNLSLNGCFALEELPEELCQLSYTERLELSCCTALKRLPDRLMEMSSLTYLNLEKCENIVHLPEGFGKLNSLQDLILNSCINLENLCGDFEGLTSLEKLILTNCQRLEGKWMDTVVKNRSLKLVDITESWKLTERWMEIRSEENEWDMTVKFYQADGDAEEEMMRKAASMVFSDECLLFDAYGCKIRPSTFVPNTTLVFFSPPHLSKDGWKRVVENIKALHDTSLELRIIQIRNYTPNLASSDKQECMLEPRGTTLSLCFKSPEVLLAFQRILSEVVGSTELQGDYVVTTTVEADNKGIKHFSRWKNISGLLKQITSKSETRFRIEKQLRTPQGNNLKSLRALLVTEGRDFLLNKDTEQVKVDALKGLKVVLLLISRLEISEIEISIVKEMYTKLRNNEYEFEVVWVPIVNLDDNDTWGSYLRAASSMPWLAVADPWSMEPAVLELVKQDWDFGHDSSSILVAVDEMGRISNKNAMDMVWRWGVEAYPFAGDAWDDLLDSEWEQLKKKSSLEFLFQNLENFSTDTVPLQGRIIWLYGGDPLEISGFAPALSSGLKGLDACTIQIIYIGGPSFPSAIEFMNTQETVFHEIRKPSIPWPTLSFLDTLRFWRRVESLWWELRDKGDNEMFTRLRKLLVSLLSLNNISHINASVWIVAMDENGEMVTDKGKDVINALVRDNWPTYLLPEKSMTRMDLIEGSKRGELTQAIKRIFQNGVITSQHDPQHPLLPFSAAYFPWPGVVCDVCDKEIMAELSFYKCSICEDINICEACMGLPHGISSIAEVQQSNLMESSDDLFIFARPVKATSSNAKAQPSNLMETGSPNVEVRRSNLAKRRKLNLTLSNFLEKRQQPLRFSSDEWLRTAHLNVQPSNLMDISDDLSIFGRVVKANLMESGVQRSNLAKRRKLNLTLSNFLEKRRQPFSSE